MPLHLFSPVLNTCSTCAVLCPETGGFHFILPLGGMWRGATTGQKESAGHEYECDGFFHDVIFVTVQISVRVPQNPRSAVLRCESSPVA